MTPIFFKQKRVGRIHSEESRTSFSSSFHKISHVSYPKVQQNQTEFRNCARIFYFFFICHVEIRARRAPRTRLRAAATRMSVQRFSQLTVSSKGGSVVVAVQPGERVSVLWSTPSGTRESVCQADKRATTMTATINSNGGWQCFSAQAPPPGLKFDDAPASSSTRLAFSRPT